ncbi:LLM class flavin-dependent oxidoreductase [Streptomyces sp. NPDC002403]
MDIGKEHHHCVVLDTQGELLSRRVLNDETALLELISDVPALSGETLWAVDINHGCAALLIGLLLSHDQPMVYITGLAVHQASTAYRGQGKTDEKDAFVIADAWLPLYWSPMRTDVYEASLTELPDGFMIAPMVRAVVCDDVAEGLLPVKAMLGFYIGGMGHAARNFHADLMARMGFEEEARRIQQLFLEGRKQEAVLAVPDAFADEISLVGPRQRIAERLELWRKGPVTDLLVTAPDPHTLRVLAELN